MFEKFDYAVAKCFIEVTGLCDDDCSDQRLMRAYLKLSLPQPHGCALLEYLIKHLLHGSCPWLPACPIELFSTYEKVLTNILLRIWEIDRRTGWQEQRLLAWPATLISRGVRRFYEWCLLQSGHTLQIRSIKTHHAQHRESQSGFISKCHCTLPIRPQSHIIGHYRSIVDF